MQKLYYSIREVSELVDEEQHILRYWEKEFPILRPKKNRGGNRTYSQRDIALIQKIKLMLRDEKISIKSAKDNLNSHLELEFAGQESKEIENNYKPEQVPIKTDKINEKIVIGRDYLIDIYYLLKETVTLLKS